MTFRKFLTDRGVDIKLFLLNCQPNHQRWVFEESINEDIKRFFEEGDPYAFIGSAFSWECSIQQGIDWSYLDTEWEDYLENNQDFNGHGFFELLDNKPISRLKDVYECTTRP